MNKGIIFTILLSVIIVSLITGYFLGIDDELAWWWISFQDEAKGYAYYLEHFPKGRHTVEAGTHYDELCWSFAKEAHMIAGYYTYLNEHPSGKYVLQAQAALDDLYWEEAKNEDTKAAYKRYIDSFPQGRHLTEAKFDNSTLKLININDLIEQNKVQVKIHGKDIENINLRIKRLQKARLVAYIPVGTFFVCNGDAQNMITTQDKVIALNDDSWVNADVSVACCNISRKIPDNQDTFDIKRSTPQDGLHQLILGLKSVDVNPEVKQAAIWIVTDDAGYADLGILKIGSYIRVINEKETALAMKICDKVGIDITKKTIWQDRERVLKGLKDEPALRDWLQKKSGL